MPMVGQAIACVMAISFTSRAWRSDELRLKEFRFADDADRMLWTDILLEGAFRVLVPHRPGSRSLADKERRVESVEDSVRSLDGVQARLNDVKRDLVTLKSLVTAFKNNNYNLKTVLRAILVSDDFTRF